MFNMIGRGASDKLFPGKQFSLLQIQDADCIGRSVIGANFALKVCVFLT